MDLAGLAAAEGDAAGAAVLGVDEDEAGAEPSPVPKG